MACLSLGKYTVVTHVIAIVAIIVVLQLSYGGYSAITGTIEATTLCGSASVVAQSRMR